MWAEFSPNDFLPDSQGWGEAYVLAFILFPDPRDSLTQNLSLGKCLTKVLIRELPWSIFLLMKGGFREAIGCVTHAGLLTLVGEAEDWLQKAGQEIFIHSLPDTNSKGGLPGTPFEVPSEGITSPSLSSVFSEGSFDALKEQCHQAGKGWWLRSQSSERETWSKSEMAVWNSRESGRRKGKRLRLSLTVGPLSSSQG